MRLGNVQYPSYEFDLDALIDTGFDSGLIVPHGTIPDDVTPDGEVACTLADGSAMQASGYLGYVSVGPLPPIGALVIALPRQAVLSRAVTNHFKLTFSYGRPVVLES